ncbi:MAG TPA: polysaccharide biosynthesis C-terminal domain-containing protein [Caproicibacter sp.]|nr:polysaccharide biosynthesis C-terminal domain-containing protein [Caproicibacter sp.]
MSKEKRIRSDVVRDSINTFGTNAIGVVLLLVSNFAVMRRVGPDIRGYYSAVQTWGGGFYTILSLSVAAAAIVYFVARYKIQNTKKSIVRLTGVVFLIIAVIGSLVLFVLRRSSLFGFGTMPVSYLAAIMVYALCSLILSACLSVLRGENKFKSFNIVNLIQKILNALLYFFIAVFPSADIWIWGTNGIAIAMIFLALYGIRRWSGPKPQPVPEDDHPVPIKSVTAYSLKAHVSNVLTYVNTFLGSYVVQGKFSIAVLGLYNTAFTIMQQVWVLPDAVSQVVMSRIAAMNKQNDKLRLTLISTKVVAYISAVTALLVLWAADIFVPLLFPKYVGALAPLAYLIVGSIFISFAKVLGNSIAAYGRPELNIIPTAVGIASNCAACLILVPLMGINGVALSTSISLTIQGFTSIAIFCIYSHTPVYRMFIPSREELASLKAIFKK